MSARHPRCASASAWVMDAACSTWHAKLTLVKLRKLGVEDKGLPIRRAMHGTTVVHGHHRHVRWHGLQRRRRGRVRVAHPNAGGKSHTHAQAAHSWSSQSHVILYRPYQRKVLRYANHTLGCSCAVCAGRDNGGCSLLATYTQLALVGGPARLIYRGRVIHLCTRPRT